MIRKLITAASFGAVLLVAATTGLWNVPPVASAAAGDAGRFVWRDLLTKDVDGARKFYGELFGWQFENTTRGDQPYVIARNASVAVAGLVDVSKINDAAPQWLSYMAVTNVDATVKYVRAGGGAILIEPRDRPLARVAVVTDPQGALLGLGQLRRDVPDPAQPAQNHFFWQEYLARDAAHALEFYKRLAGYESTIGESRLGTDYHLLQTTRPRAGLFQLPAKTDVRPNWLPYVLVNDPAAVAARVTGLGGQILLPAAPERRNGSLVVIADPGGAPLALQKFPF